MNDWNTLTNPDPTALQRGKDIVEDTLSTIDTNKTPTYLYWVSKDEIVTAELTKGKIKFEYLTHTAGTADGEYLVFVVHRNIVDSITI